MSDRGPLHTAATNPARDLQASKSKWCDECKSLATSCSDSAMVTFPGRLACTIRVNTPSFKQAASNGPLGDCACGSADVRAVLQHHWADIQHYAACFGSGQFRAQKKFHIFASGSPPGVA
jgi:hypothetical protein